MRLRHPQPDPSISTKTYRRIISGRTPPAWGTWGMWGTWGTSHPGSADQLKDGQRSSKHSKPEQGNRDVLKRLGFEPVDDVAAVMKGQKGFRAEAEKACKRQPQEEPVWAQLQRPCRQDESCERKRWGGRRREKRLPRHPWLEFSAGLVSNGRRKRTVPVQHRRPR